MPTMKKAPAKRNLWFRLKYWRIGKSRFRLRDLLVAAAGIISFSFIENVGKTFDVWDKAQLALGFKPDALAIARSSEMEHSTRELLRLAYRLVHEIRNYGDLILGKRPGTELDEAYAAYVRARMAWDEHSMTNVLLVQKWYGTAKARTLENDIEPLFVQAYWCINDLRSEGVQELNRSLGSCRQDRGGTADVLATNITQLRTITNVLLLRLYCFAAGIDAELPLGLIGRKEEGSKGAPERCG